MSKQSPKKPKNPGWKERKQTLRRAAAEERQKNYNALSMENKMKRAGHKELGKLLGKK